MSYLDSTTKGKVKAPFRFGVYGVEGTGKSSECANAPGAYFIPTEDGTFQIKKATRGRRVENFDEIFSIIDDFIKDPRGTKTLIIDTLNGLEKLLHADMIAADSKADTVADTKGGFGKGFMFAESKFGALFAKLDELIRKQGINVILIAHALDKDFNDPRLEGAYKKYTPNLEKKVSDRFRQWCDAVFFVAPETTVSEDKRTKKLKAYLTGDSIVYTQARAAFDAKNRYGLPLQLTWNWDTLMEAIDNADPDDEKIVMSEIEGYLEKILDEEFKAIVVDQVNKSVGNTSRLKRIAEKLETRLQDV